MFDLTTSGSGRGPARLLRRLPTALGGSQRHEASDAAGQMQLTCDPTVRRSVRKGRHQLGGPLGDGWTLDRTSFERFRLLDPSGVRVASFQGRGPRPSRGMRRALEVATSAGASVRLEEHATRNTLKAMRQELTGEAVARWTCDGLTVEVRPGRATVTPGEAWPADDRLAIVTGLVAWRLTVTASP